MRRLLRAALLIALPWQVAVAAAQDANAPSHHRPDGFQNNYLEFTPKGLGALLQWKVDAARAGLPKPPQSATPTVTPERDFIRANARAGAAMQPSVTWIGHASALLQLGGLNLLTDPIFSERASPLAFAGPQRHVAPGLALAELPHIDVVLISHNHYDHLDDASVRALAAQPGGQPLFVVPLGLKAWFAARDIEHVVELDWWQSHLLPGAAGPVEVVMTPVQHWSGRSLTDRLKTLWGGYAVFAPELHLFFGGDTAYSQDFADIARRFAARQTPALGGGFDLALLPIGAYEPRWFMRSQHVDPDEAVQIHLDLHAKRSLGIHWGTFELTDESLDRPPIDLAAARAAHQVPDADFFVLAIGQTRRLPRREAR
ncbi:MAG TPA: MBL fold metallo-hydrolase [Burkholderiaceae bacterium]|nr:MBL fold metallo-hydrolase [Burkholderiaceae bacterium]